MMRNFMAGMSHYLSFIGAVANAVGAIGGDDAVLGVYQDEWILLSVNEGLELDGYLVHSCVMT